MAEVAVHALLLRQLHLLYYIGWSYQEKEIFSALGAEALRPFFFASTDSIKDNKYRNLSIEIHAHNYSK
jgi:hypothetical protein